MRIWILTGGSYYDTPDLTLAFLFRRCAIWAAEALARGGDWQRINPDDRDTLRWEKGSEIMSHTPSAYLEIEPTRLNLWPRTSEVEEPPECDAQMTNVHEVAEALGLGDTLAFINTAKIVRRNHGIGSGETWSTWHNWACSDPNCPGCASADAILRMDTTNARGARIPPAAHPNPSYAPFYEPSAPTVRPSPATGAMPAAAGQDANTAPSIRCPAEWEKFLVAVQMNDPHTHCATCDTQTWHAWREGWCLAHTQNTQPLYKLGADYLPDGSIDPRSCIDSQEK